MNSLRFVSISDDGASLILSNGSGDQFSVPVTDELKVAVNRRHRSSGSEEPVKLSPREIQNRVRHGASAEEIAQQTGLPLDRVESYAAPVRAEREYAASLARQVEVSDRTLTRDAIRAVFGEQPVTIEAMVEHRASLSGLSAESLEWDAWRRADGQWEVSLGFDVVDDSSLQGTDLIDAEPEARWVFNPVRKSLSNINRWAQFLSELEPLESVNASRRLNAVVSEPLAENDDAATVTPFPSAQQSHSPKDPDSGELLDMLQQRRGTRLGSDEESDDKLAQIISDGQRAAAARQAESIAPAADVSEIPQVPADEVAADRDDISARRLRPKKTLKDRRSRVPSWDQIYFGTKPDTDD